ncbi:MAG: type I-U CRISPR-associated protein Csb2 [Phycisphaerales bacterium JB039]
MSQYLCLSITFLDGRFHGRRDGGAPEWPPSPLRLFQAMVAAAAAGGDLAGLGDALRWLERQAPPLIVAPRAAPGAAYRLSVPNNAMDVVAKAWARGRDDGAGDANPAKHRTMKTVRPMRMVDGEQLHYLWAMPDAPSADDLRHAQAVAAAARAVVALGWGVDLVVGHGQVVAAAEAKALQGERWAPRGGAGPAALRVPVGGSLRALERRHEAFTNRVQRAGFAPVAPLTTFAAVTYRRDTDPAPRPIAAFSLLRLDGEGFRAFSTGTRTLSVAGMARHALAGAARQAGWAEDRINEVILGHSPDGAAPARSDPQKPRFTYAPLPSIEFRGAGRAEVIGPVRRLLLVGSEAPEAAELVAWAWRALAGADLVDEQSGEPCGVLAPIQSRDRMVRRFTEAAARWATVTPIVLDRHPKARQRADAQEAMREIVASACLRAGLPTPADVAVAPVSALAGAPHARDFTPLRRKDGSAPNQTHAVIQFAEPVPGPVLVGAGRFRGYGLCAPWLESVA